MAPHTLSKQYQGTIQPHISYAKTVHLREKKRKKREKGKIIVKKITAKSPWPHMSYAKTVHLRGEKKRKKRKKGKIVLKKIHRRVAVAPHVIRKHGPASLGERRDVRRPDVARH